MHTNKHHACKGSLKMAASLFLDSPLFFNGPEVPAVPEDQQQEKRSEQAGDQQRDKRPTTYRPQQEQEERMQEEENLQKIESRMERSQPQESPEKNREIVKKLNEHLQRTIAAYPEGLKQTKTFQDALSRVSFGEENGRTFLNWNVPERLKGILMSDIGREMIQTMGGPNMEITPDGSVRLYESPERLNQRAERLVTMMSTGPVEESDEDRQQFDRQQHVQQRSTTLFVSGAPAPDLKVEENYTRKVNEIKKNLPADFAKMRIGAVLLNAQFVTDGSKVLMVVPEKCAAEFRMLLTNLPNLFKGDIEKDKDGNYAVSVNNRTMKTLLFTLADYTPQGGGIDWEAPEMQKFSKKFPEIARGMQEHPEKSIPERDSIAAVQQTQRLKSVQ